MSVLIIGEQDDPIVDLIRPFAIRQKGFGVCSQCTEQSRNVSVTPADQNYFSLVVRTQVSGQVSRLIVTKTGIDCQFCRLREWFQRQTRRWLFFESLAAKIAGFPPLRIHGEISEVVLVCVGPLFATRRDTGAGVGVFGVANNSTTASFGPSCASAASVSVDARRIAVKRRLCMNVIVDVRGMNVNMRVSEDPIEGFFTFSAKGALQC